MGPPSSPEALPRVLLVDDDESQRVTASALLEERFDVKSAASAEQALVLLRHHAIDVLCADFQMPGMNGLELLGRVAERYPNVGCVLITGHKDFLSRGGGMGGKLLYAVLLKPYDAVELVERVERAAQLSAIRRRMVRPVSATAPPAPVAGLPAGIKRGA